MRRSQPERHEMSCDETARTTVTPLRAVASRRARGGCVQRGGPQDRGTNPSGLTEPYLFTSIPRQGAAPRNAKVRGCGASAPTFRPNPNLTNLSWLRRAQFDIRPSDCLGASGVGARPTTDIAGVVGPRWTEVRAHKRPCRRRQNCESRATTSPREAHPTEVKSTNAAQTQAGGTAPVAKTDTREASSGRPRAAPKAPMARRHVW